MITEHHKLSNYIGEGLVETFRKADLIDFSLGFIRHGLDKDLVNRIL